jgi:hypothetical protein
VCKNECEVNSGGRVENVEKVADREQDEEGVED